MAFIDLATLKERLRIPAADTSQDDLLTGIVDGVNAELLNLFTLTVCAETTYTHSFDVLDEVQGIWLRSYPVTGVTTVTVDGTVQAAGTYYLDQRTEPLGSLMRKSAGAASAKAYWPIGPQVVTVEYTAGWTSGTPDAALISAAVAIAVWIYNTEPKAGFESERIGQYAYKLASGAAGVGYGGPNAGGFPPGAARVLAQWVRPFADWS